ncbi:hypothetical protein [Myxosarcina sp. GI1(2024)]
MITAFSVFISVLFANLISVYLTVKFLAFLTEAMTGEVVKSQEDIDRENEFFTSEYYNREFYN